MPSSALASTGPIQILLPQIICFALNRSIIRNETEEHFKAKISELNFKVQELEQNLFKAVDQNLKLVDETNELKKNISTTQNELERISKHYEVNLNATTEELKDIKSKYEDTKEKLLKAEEKLKDISTKYEDTTVKLNKTEEQLKDLSTKCSNTESVLASTEKKLNETERKYNFANKIIDALIPDRGKLLTEATASGNSSLSMALIQLGAPVNIKDTFGYTPADWAVLEGDADTMKQLLQAGTDVNALQGDNKDSLLHVAARNGNEDIVKALLQYKANPNFQNKFQNTPLHEAANFGHDAVAKALIDAGAQVDARNNNNMTPLLFAAEKGHLDVVQLLVQKGADRNVRNKAGRTPEEEARQRGKQNVSWWLGQLK